MTTHGGIAGAQLKTIVERAERLNEEIAALNDDKKDIFAEAKANGFDVPTIKEVIKLRKMDASERQEKEALLDLYLHALGMLPDDGTALATRAPAPGGKAAAKSEPAKELVKA